MTIVLIEWYGLCIISSEKINLAVWFINCILRVWF